MPTDQTQAVRQHAISDVLDIGLVDGDQDVRRNRLNEAVQRVRVDDGRCRIVGVADENQPGVFGDRGEHGIEVEGVVGQGHLDGGRTGDLNLWRVELKAAPPEDHLVSRRGGDLNQLLAEADGTATDGDLFGGEVQPLGQRGFEFHAAVVGVAVGHIGGPLDGRADAGQRTEHRLVAGQFDGTRHRFAWHVNG